MRTIAPLLVPFLTVTIALLPACSGTVSSSNRPGSYASPPAREEASSGAANTSPAAEAAAPAEPETAPEEQPKRRSEWPYVVGGILVASAIVFAGLIAALAITFERAWG